MKDRLLRRYSKGQKSTGKDKLIPVTDNRMLEVNHTLTQALEILFI